MSTERHKILIVEDDREFATMLDEMLSALYDVTIVASAEKALPLIHLGDFCLLILDQQILPREGSKVPAVEAGKDLLEVARTTYSERNAKGKHHLQILVMSGHARTINFAVRAMQDGADDFILKPLSDNEPDWRDKIRNALRHSGRRDDHERCAELTEAARKKTATRLLAERSENPFRLSVPGTWGGDYTDLEIGGKKVKIPNSQFVTLLHLIAARAAKDGCLVLKDFTNEAEPWRRFDRLRSDLRPHLPESVPKGGVENVKTVGYRLHELVVLGAMNWEALVTHPVEKVQSLAKKQSKARPR